MQPHWHYRHVCIRFRAGLWVTSTGQAHWGPVLLNNTRLHARVHMPPGLYVCSQSHPEHQWHSGSVHYWEANFDFDRKIIADKIQSRFSYNLKFKSLLFLLVRVAPHGLQKVKCKMCSHVYSSLPPQHWHFATFSWKTRSMGAACTVSQGQIKCACLTLSHQEITSG